MTLQTLPGDRATIALGKALTAQLASAPTDAPPPIRTMVRITDASAHPLAGDCR
jgi:hypothetical protein